MRIILIALLAAISYAQTGYKIPCIAGSKSKPAGCEKRIKRCKEFTKAEKGDAIVIKKDKNYKCSAMTPRMKDTVHLGDVSENTYYVEFDDRKGKCYAIIMQAGECWGKHPTNTDSTYDSQGKCGSSSTNGQANWARDCLKHDACSWYFGATGKAADKDCGDEFYHAHLDWSRPGTSCKTYGNSCKNQRYSLMDTKDPQIEDKGRCAREKYNSWESNKCECDGYVKIGKKSSYSKWVPIKGSSIQCDVGKIGFDPLPGVRKYCRCGELKVEHVAKETEVSDSFIPAGSQNMLLLGGFLAITILVFIFWAYKTKMEADYLQLLTESEI